MIYFHFTILPGDFHASANLSVSLPLPGNVHRLTSGVTVGHFDASHETQANRA